MQILNSEWLIKMLEKSGVTPETRLLSLFDILDDWAEAPQLNILVKQEIYDRTIPHLLLGYLTIQAQQVGSAMPETLAEQFIFLASSALKERVDNTKSESLQQAKRVAKALIDAQCERPNFRVSKSKIYNTLFIVLGIITISTLIFKNQGNYLFLDRIAKYDVPTLLSNEASLAENNKNNAIVEDPKSTADMYASIETMRGGDCQFIEALQIPDADKKIYLENVVGGEVPSNAHDQMIAQHYMQKIRCNYTPMLMKNSTN